MDIGIKCETCFRSLQYEGQAHTCSDEIETPFFCLKCRQIEESKKACCVFCGDKTVYECEQCFAILDCDYQEHLCPDQCMKARTPVCDKCYETITDELTLD